MEYLVVRDYVIGFDSVLYIFFFCPLKVPEFTNQNKILTQKYIIEKKKFFLRKWIKRVKNDLTCTYQSTSDRLECCQLFSWKIILQLYLSWPLLMMVTSTAIYQIWKIVDLDEQLKCIGSKWVVLDPVVMWWWQDHAVHGLKMKMNLMKETLFKRTII